MQPSAVSRDFNISLTADTAARPWQSVQVAVTQTVHSSTVAVSQTVLYPVCSYLKPDENKKSKHKTTVKKKTLNPEFNEVRRAPESRCSDVSIVFRALLVLLFSR